MYLVVLKARANIYLQEQTNKKLDEITSISRERNRSQTIILLWLQQ